MTQVTIDTAEHVRRRQETLDWVTAHPEVHDQDFFVKMPEDHEYREFVPFVVEGRCGTTACIAGRVALQTVPDGTLFNEDHIRFPDGREVDMEDYAAEYLGLTADQSDALFYCFDNARAIKRLQALIDNPMMDGEALREIM